MQKHVETMAATNSDQESQMQKQRISRKRKNKYKNVG